eukprot:jgi/Chrpa1/19314/Chrysochromulina_OHIO_Genome00024131-RA
MPWSVGRYSSALDFSRLGPLVEADAALTQSRGQGPMQVQEGTAIYKFAANDAESAEPGTSPQGPRPFVTASIDGVEAPGDLYLTIAGQFAAAARGGPPLPPMPPIQI